jgi:hypothetical protein
VRDGKPLAYDGYCGLGGWAEGLLAEGFHVVGFDTEAHDYGSGGYPGELVIRDVTTIHGSELADADLLVFSPPCQRYSYMAMPWSRAKAQAAMIEADTTGEELRKLNLLFDTCFRLQREASEAAGHHIPMIVENVRGAQRWVGKAAYHYGSFYLWGDIPALMPIVASRKLKTTGPVDAEQSELHNCHINEMRDSHKVPGFRFDGSGKSFQTASVEATGKKNPGGGSRSRDRPSHTTDHSWDSGQKIPNQGLEQRHPRGISPQWRAKKYGDAVKVPGIDLSTKAPGFNVTAAARYREGVKFEANSSREWFDGKPKDKMLGDKGPAAYGSRSNSRKAASAMIAKIPFPLALHIARSYRP